MFAFGITGLIVSIITLFIAFPVHELAHAWTAEQLGDSTPRRTGRLSLNPLVHLDLLGSILFLAAGFGWAKPVPFNPYNFRNGPQLGTVVVAAAGPFSNFVMALLAAIPFRLGAFAGVQADSPLAWVVTFLDIFIQLNIFLLLFNLIPVVPLDGSKILRGLAPREWDRPLDQLERWGPFILLALVFIGRPVLGVLIGQPAGVIYRALVG
jgi:Zn-dependent protease